MKFFTKLFLLLPLLLCVSCKSNVDKSDVLVVATSPDNPPYEFFSEGKVKGFDVDLMQHIADTLGRKLEWRTLPFPSLFPALLTGEVNLVIAGLTSTPERQEKVSFSDNYDSSNMALLVNQASEIAALKDLHGKVLGVQSGSTWELSAKELQKSIPGIELRSLSSNLLLIEELKAKRIDAVLLETPQVSTLTSVNPELKGVDFSGLNQGVSVALRKNDPLITKINEVILLLKNNGTIDSLKQKWLK